METYEKLGAFYLGKGYDASADRITDDLILYDAKDLTTHAVCVGMTGSGKTGLCVTLLEEAAIDGIPAIAIDPKGDLGNLMLTFPKLRAQDFRPWIDPGEAARHGRTPEEHAADRARLWKKGLDQWGQDGGRIRRFRDAVDINIYTPGSDAGLPLGVLRSFAAPPAALLADDEALRDRVTSAVSGLLALLGLDVDPIRSREHILLSMVLDRTWRSGRDLDLAALIQAIQTPPFDKVGVMDLESFFPAGDRFALAMLLNNLLASPGFAAWMQGEPLDVSRLLYTAEGRPRLSILSIAHLSDEARMFFVTVLLNEIVAWMRTQPGTSSLRALLYMDEIFGFFPPTANPPSKRPMLTLLKQARAYGLGVVLATQNPVDLDYKGLSNAGTWLLGRLQTERDKMRVLDGLEGAGAGFDRAEMDALLSGLRSRVFLMNNVHEDEPVLLHTRWALSYLRGPLTRAQIQTLTTPGRAAAAAAAPTPAATPAPRPVAPPAVAAPAPAGPPTLPPSVTQLYLPLVRSIPAGGRLVYRPVLAAVGRLHFVRTGAKVDFWDEVAMLAPLDDEVATDPWEEAAPFPSSDPDLETTPRVGATFAALPAAATRAASYTRWSRAFVQHLYRHRTVAVLRSPELKRYSEPGEGERDFRIRLRQVIHEKRDLQVEKLRKRYASKLATLKERLRKAEAAVEREHAEYKQAGLQTALSLGSTVLGALFGRKAASVGTVGRASTTLRGAGRTARQRGDIARAGETVEAVGQRLADLEEEFASEVAKVEDKADVDALDFEEIVIRPRKGDLSVKRLVLGWAPHVVDAGGRAEPAFA